MTISQKKKKLLKAIASGKYSKRSIDVKGKGSAIKNMERGKGISDGKVNELYDRLMELESKPKIKTSSKQTSKQTKIKLPKKQIKQTKQVFVQKEELQELKTKLQEQDVILRHQSRIIEGLQDKVELLENDINKNKQTSKQATFFTIPEPKQTSKQTILGFTLKQTTTKSKGKTYYVYKAFRCVNKIPMHVYIGNDESKAEEKIINYLRKNQEQLTGVIPVIAAEYPEKFSAGS